MTVMELTINLCSETAPNEGTLKVFPNVMLSNAYTIMRPFFVPIVAPDSPDLLDPKNWKYGEPRYQPRCPMMQLTSSLQIFQVTTSPGSIPLGRALPGRVRMPRRILI